MITLIRGKKMMIRAYRTPADRRRAVGNLRRHGYNYFVCYREAGELPINTGHRCALNYAKVDWLKHGRIYIDA
jgi:hypothetical protein